MTQSRAAKIGTPAFHDGARQSCTSAMVVVMALALTGFAPQSIAGDMAEQTTVNAHSDREAKLTTPV